VTGARLSERDLREADDATLGAAIVSRDQGALAELYQRNGATALALARRVLGDRVLAEEVVQEVFGRTWRQPERYDPNRGSMRSFLLAQVHGRAVDLLRAESARRAREQREAFRAPRDHDDLEREVLDLAEAEAVRTALMTLADGERAAIELAYFGGHTYKEVAVLLEQPEGTVKSRIRSGLLRLRAHSSARSTPVTTPIEPRPELDALLGAYVLDALEPDERTGRAVPRGQPARPRRSGRTAGDDRDARRRTGR
jgi:RNA polymerase sigma-70 factor (ECF subfamily)